jgi:hypothetical protein
MLRSVVGRLLPTFWENLSVQPSRVKVFLTLEDGMYRLVRNFGNELPVHPGKEKITKSALLEDYFRQFVRR